MSSVLISELKCFFLHIPKTAGYSLSCGLLGAFPTAERKPTRNMRHLRGAAEDMRHRFGRRIIEDNFSFFSVRNPWAWTVSGWKHVTQNRRAYGGSPPDFASFVLGDWARHLDDNPNKQKFRTAKIFVAYHTQITQMDHLNWSFFRRPAPMGFYGRFEQLEEDLEIICDRLGREIKLPKKNISGGKPYTDFYDDELRNIVADRNENLIERFGFKFDDAAI